MSNVPYLPIAVKNISITLEDIIKAFEKEPDYKLLYFDRISDLFRQIAVGEFLMTNDHRQFFAYLQKGVQSYIEFLEYANQAEKAASHTMVFFDAVCINDRASMGKLALLSTRSINPRKEYGEDFYYLRILMDVFGEDKTPEDVSDLLDEFEELSSENSDDRFNLIKALLERDKKLFKESLEYLMDERMETYKSADLYSGKLDESAVMSHVSTEVVAWLKLAKQQGIGLEDCGEFTLAPCSAINELTLPALGNGQWRKFESYSSIDYKR